MVEVLRCVDIMTRFMDESPRWLMLQGRLEEAAKTLRKAARWHRVTLPPQKELVVLLEKFKLEVSDVITVIPS